MCDLHIAGTGGEGAKLPDLLSLDDAAEYFDCCTRTLRRWIKAGELHPIRIGRRIFIRADEIARLVHIDLLDGILPGGNAPGGGK
jgi:excisionase family DNA binding protein